MNRNINNKKKENTKIKINDNFETINDKAKITSTLHGCLSKKDSLDTNHLYSNIKFNKDQLMTLKIFQKLKD